MVAEGLRTIEAADRHLAESRFTEAAQLYAKAATLLAEADPSVAAAIGGCHHLAKAIGLYFDDKTQSALQALETAQGLFRSPAHTAHFRFCQALLGAFRSLQAHESDDYSTAHGHLAQAIPLLEEVSYSFPEFAGGCAFWKDWASVHVYGGQLCDQLDDLTTEEAEALQAIVGNHITALIERAPDENARVFFTLSGDIYAAVVQLSRAIEAFQDRAHRLALRTFDALLPTLQSACARIAHLNLPAHVRHLNESFLFMEAMAQGLARLTKAEMCIYSGNRVAAMRFARDAVTVLRHRRTQFTPSIRGGMGYDIDIDDIVGEAKKFAAMVGVGDPGIMALESEVAKIVPPAQFKGTVAQMRELTNAYTSGLWVSSLALAGGLIEALLLAAIMSNAEPATGGIAPAEVTRLTSLALGNLIREAEQRNILRKGASHLSDGVREFRNLLHPGKRIRDGHDPAKAEAHAACAVLQIVIQDLARAAEEQASDSV